MVLQKLMDLQRILYDLGFKIQVFAFLLLLSCLEVSRVLLVKEKSRQLLARGRLDTAGSVIFGARPRRHTRTPHCPHRAAAKGPAVLRKVMP